MSEKETSALHEKLTTGLALQQNNQVEQAILLFQEILQHWPHQPDALHGLGMSFAQQRQYAKAVEFLQKAVKFAPHIAEFHNNLANAYKNTGRMAEAFQHYHEALRLKPIYPQAHNNLGALLYQLGKYEEACQHLQKAIRMDPLFLEAHYNLANTYVQLDRLTDAAAHFKAVLKQRPEHLGALHNLGIILCHLKNFQEAQQLLTQVVEREPTNIDALFHLGVIYSALAQTKNAQDCYERVIALQPNHAHSHHNLATIFLHLNQPEQALKHYQTALSLEPSNKTAQHMIAALRGQSSEAGAPFEYTRALFDQYAYNYDEHVKKQLKYQVPHLLREMIAPFIPQFHQAWQGLDLGCGTGLCAPLFADVTAKLIGVDISPNMIERARQLGGYYKLYVQDILSFLAQQEEPFDLIISADVLVYFGALTHIFAACHRVLKPKGLWCFSIETLPETETAEHLNLVDFQLRKTGRYAHQPHYIQQLAEKYGFHIGAQKSAIIRYQDDLPLAGELYVLQKI